jgi:hypothetical protein
MRSVCIWSILKKRSTLNPANRPPRTKMFFHWQRRDCKTNKLRYETGYNLAILFFLLFNSFRIKISSRLLCPATEVFSSALLRRYGITDFTGPYGTYLATR